MKQKIINIIWLISVISVLASLLTLWIEWATISNFHNLIDKHSTSFLKYYISHPGFKISITFALSLITVFNLIEYLGNFNPKRALIEAVVPLVLLILTCQWTEVLSWHSCP